MIVKVKAGPKDTAGTPTVQNGKWSQVVQLDGYGDHPITVTCVNGEGIEAPAATVTIRVAETLPALPVDRRLFLVETIALSSFNGDFGAGGILKSLSLGPKEEVEIQIETYRKDEQTERAAQSILDSTASESASDFEQTLSEEQNRRAQGVESTSLTIGAELGARFGTIATASLKSNYATTSNATREQVTKDLRTAIEKHAMKASANRSVNVNHEFTRTSTSGTTETTKRRLVNMNASCVLSYVFRGAVQEKLVVTHMTDARLGYFEQDVVLDANGNAESIRERYAEYTLPEFLDLAAAVLTGGENAARDAQTKLEDMLGSIVNADGLMVSLIEAVIPTKNGQPLPDKRYLRVNPRRFDTWKPRGDTGPTVRVAGIALSRQQLMMRTEGVLVGRRARTGQCARRVLPRPAGGGDRRARGRRRA